MANPTTLTTIDGNENANILSGTSKADIINGHGGNDIIRGYGGNDTLDGGAGSDELMGGAGADSLSGHAGDDTYGVDNVGDIVVEDANEGVDTVKSSISYILGANVENLVLTGHRVTNGTGNNLDNCLTGNDAANILDGGAGDDILRGGGGKDQLTGGDGNDALGGGSGKDRLTGGAGDDWLVGGADADTFVYTIVGSGHDTVTDFVAKGQGHDLIEMNKSIFTGWTALKDHISQSGADTVIQLDANNDIPLLGVNKDSLSSQDFKFV
jgi:Ca2+-binding RTX toxin-like protein